MTPSVKASNTGSGMPLPVTGHAIPRYDEEAITRAAQALEAFSTIYLIHEPQQAILARVEQLRRRTVSRRGVPLPGLRLSQHSQAGKSKMFDKYRDHLANERRRNGLPPKRHQVLIIGLEKSSSLKGVFQSILIQLEDSQWHRGTEMLLKQRVREFMVKLEVELLVIDEIQHLRRGAGEVVDVTDAIKRFLDDGIVPCVLVGNEDSQALFERNKQLASRLGVPLDLSPLNPRSARQASLFKSFCLRLDEAMVAAGVTKCLAGLAEPAALKALFAASSGHIGRVARVVEAALEHSSQRDAEAVELYDLSFAIDTFAIPQGYLRANPLESAE
jgi:hypothetical protein